MTTNFTKGPILKNLIIFSIPILIGNIFQSCYVVADTVIVGRFVGVDALAAIGSVGTLVFLILGFINGMTSGCAVISAQRYGANDIEGLRNSFATSIVIGIVVTVIFTIVGISISRPLLELINTPNDIIDLAHLYVVIIYCGTISSTAYNALGNIIRSMGNSRIPLYFLIIASIANISFNLLFTIVFNFGVSGVAFGTILAQTIAAICCVVYIKIHLPLLHLETKHFSLNKKEVLIHIKMALPMAFQYSIISFGFIFVQSSINKFGTDAIAAVSIAQRIEQFAILVFPVLGTALATFCAHNIGANQFNRIHKGIIQCQLLAIFIAICGSIFILVMDDFLISIFTEESNPTMMLLCKQYLSYSAPCYILLSVIFILRQSLQGLGITMFTMIVSIVELVVRWAIATYLPFTLSFIDICLSTPAAWVCASLLFVIRYIVYYKQNLSSKENLVP